MKAMRQSIQDGEFPAFVSKFFMDMFPNGEYPQWAIDALASVGINLKLVKFDIELSWNRTDYNSFY